jgi:hypothetical protein
VTASDWSIVASLATAAGTLALAIATFFSIRSASRAARVAERSLLAGTQPILAPSRPQDPDTKIMFMGDHWVIAKGGQGVAEVTEDVIYLAISIRNVGPGLGVLHSWAISMGEAATLAPHADPVTFHRLTRDLYVPSGEMGFWQGALRDPATAEFAAVTRGIRDKERMAIDILYGDHEGGQRVISRFSLTAYDDRWLASVGRYWNLDRAEPR